MKTSKEQIISALLTHKTNEQAAEALQMSVSQLQARLREPDLRDALNEHVTNILSETSRALLARMMQAVDTLSDIMSDQDAAPQVKVNAANAVLSHCGKLLTLSRAAQRFENDDLMDAQLGFGSLFTWKED